MVDQDPDLRDLMRQARAGLSPTDVDLAAVHVRLENALWDVSPTGPARSRSNNERWRRWVQGGLVGLVAGASLGFYLGGEFTASVDPNAGPGASTIEPSPLAANASAAATLAPLPRPTNAVEDERSEDAIVRPVQSSVAAAPPPSGSREERVKRRTLGGAEDSQTTETTSAPDEVEFVRRAQRALARKEPTLALGLLKQLDERLPKGRLLEERYAGKAIARCMLTPNEGHDVQRAFARRYPQSVHGERVNQVCLGDGVRSEESAAP